MSTTSEVRVVPIPDFDEYGFLIESDKWTGNIANLIAMWEGVYPLTPDQWRILYALRAHYARSGGVPALRNICRHVDMDEYCVTTEFHHDVKEAWRLAGLPDPGEEARAYM